MFRLLNKHSNRRRAEQIMLNSECDMKSCLPNGILIANSFSVPTVPSIIWLIAYLYVYVLKADQESNFSRMNLFSRKRNFVVSSRILLYLIYYVPQFPSIETDLASFWSSRVCLKPYKDFFLCCKVILCSTLV